MERSLQSSRAIRSFGDLPGLAQGLGLDIHLWLGRLAALPSAVTFDVCNDAERRRSGQFASPAAAADYLKARALLRHVLSAYSGAPPQTLAFDAGKDGKPQIPGSAIAFNLSHSGPHVAIAVRHGESVGVDVQIAQSVDELAIARSLFAPAEVALLENLERADRRRHFFRIWTSREAVLKAAGVGMKGRGLVLRPGAGDVYAVSSRSPEWNRMRLHEFDPSGESYGALAWPETAARPQVRQFVI